VRRKVTNPDPKLATAHVSLVHLGRASNGRSRCQFNTTQTTTTQPTQTLKRSANSIEGCLNGRRQLDLDGPNRARRDQLAFLGCDTSKTERPCWYQVRIMGTDNSGSGSSSAAASGSSGAGIRHQPAQRRRRNWSGFPSISINV